MRRLFAMQKVEGSNPFSRLPPFPLGDGHPRRSRVTPVVRGGAQTSRPRVRPAMSDLLPTGPDVVNGLRVSAD
jgi:hypothetical protein